MKLENHVVEMCTGEGKSVTLVVSAIILALLGYEVDVVCYSDYLSKRDMEANLNLLEHFGIKKFIRYGTFKDLCEIFLNERSNTSDNEGQEPKGHR